jgi:hypothetical protein
MDCVAAREELGEYERQLAAGKQPMLGLVGSEKLEMLNLGTYFDGKNGKTIPKDQLSEYEANAVRMVELLDRSKASLPEASRKKIDTGITQLMETLPGEKRQELIAKFDLKTPHYKYELLTAESYRNPEKNSIAENIAEYRTHGGLDFPGPHQAPGLGNYPIYIMQGYKAGLGDRLNGYLDPKEARSDLAPNERILLEQGRNTKPGDYNAAICTVDTNHPDRVTITQILDEKSNTFKKINPVVVQTALLGTPVMKPLLADLRDQEVKNIAVTHTEKPSDSLHNNTHDKSTVIDYDEKMRNLASSANPNLNGMKLTESSPKGTLVASLKNGTCSTQAGGIVSENTRQV